MGQKGYMWHKGHWGMPRGCNRCQRAIRRCRGVRGVLGTDRKCRYSGVKGV